VSSVEDFSSVLLPESGAEVADENFSWISFSLLFGMKGTCELQRNHNYSTFDYSTNPPREVKHSEPKTIKSCKDPEWIFAPFQPDVVGDVTADKGGDKPDA